MNVAWKDYLLVETVLCVSDSRIWSVLIIIIIILTLRSKL